MGEVAGQVHRDSGLNAGRYLWRENGKEERNIGKNFGMRDRYEKLVDGEPWNPGCPLEGITLEKTPPALDTSSYLGAGWWQHDSAGTLWSIYSMWH